MSFADSDKVTPRISVKDHVVHVANATGDEGIVLFIASGDNRTLDTAMVRWDNGCMTATPLVNLAKVTQMRGAGYYRKRGDDDGGELGPWSWQAAEERPVMFHRTDPGRNYRKMMVTPDGD